MKVCTMLGPGCCAAGRLQSQGTTGPDFVHYKLALEALDSDPNHRLRQYGALYINQMLLCISVCRANAASDVLKSNSRMETMFRNLAAGEQPAWASGNSAMATFGNGPLRDVLPVWNQAMGGARMVFTRNNHRAQLYSALEQALCKSMCHWLGGGAPGINWPSSPDERPPPPPTEGATAELWYYLTGWLLVMCKVWAFKLQQRCNGAPPKRLRGTKAAREIKIKTEDRLRQFIDEFVASASMSKDTAKRVRMPTAMADGNGHRSWNQHEAQYSGTKMYHWFATVERAVLFNLEDHAFTTRHGHASLLVIKEAMLSSPLVTSLLEQSFSAALRYDERFRAPDSPSGVDPLLRDALLRHLLYYYFRMRGKDYVKALRQTFTTEQGAKQHVGFRSHVATVPLRAKRSAGAALESGSGSGVSAFQETVYDGLALTDMALGEGEGAAEGAAEGSDGEDDDAALLRHCEAYDALFTPVQVGQIVFAVEERLLGVAAAPMKAEVLIVDAERKAAFVHYAHDRSKKAWDQWVPFHNVHLEPPPAVEDAPPAVAEPVLCECSALVRGGGSRTFYYCDRTKAATWEKPPGTDTVVLKWRAVHGTRPDPPP